jgi:hypothetical protein
MPDVQITLPDKPANGSIAEFVRKVCDALAWDGGSWLQASALFWEALGNQSLSDINPIEAMNGVIGTMLHGREDAKDRRANTDKVMGPYQVQSDAPDSEQATQPASSSKDAAPSGRGLRRTRRRS